MNFDVMNNKERRIFHVILFVYNIIKLKPLIITPKMMKINVLLPVDRLGELKLMCDPNMSFY